MGTDEIVKASEASPDASSKGKRAESAADRLLRDGQAVNDRRREVVEALLEEGKNLAAPLLEQVKDESRPNPDRAMLQKPVDLFEMVLELELGIQGPELQKTCGTAEEEIEKLVEAGASVNLVDDSDEEKEQERPPPNHEYPYDVIIVGAGASGVGMGLMLTKFFNLDPERVVLVERGEKVGESFRRWPREMRFISPSFNNQGWTNSFDLNSVAYGTSPAYTIQTEHPTGQEYAQYLHELAKNGELNIRYRTQVRTVQPIRRGGFRVDVVPAREEGAGWADGSKETEVETLRSRYVIWAAGEFQYPRDENNDPLFPGSELCRHNSSIRSWKKLPGNDFVVIGGYESGMDAVYNLTACGKQSTVVSGTAFWNVTTDDPSTELSPYTMERVRQAFQFAAKPPRLLAPLRVYKVEKDQSGDGFVVRARWGPPVTHEGGEHRTPFHDDDAEIEEIGEEGAEVTLHTPQAPLLCTGFAGSVKIGVAKDLFEWGDEDAGGCLAGAPLLNDVDESTKTPGLFLVGPAVRHDDHIFCFVYKFRQRFGVVADTIAKGLDFDTEAAVEECRELNMYLDDFSCCKGACGEVC